MRKAIAIKFICLTPN